MSLSSIFEALPDELLLRLISFLPAKDICEYRSVSKQWKDLAEDQPYLWKLLCEREGIVTKTAHKSWEWEYKARMRKFTTEPTGTTVGTFVDAEGNSFSGDWTNGQREGYGFSSTANGIIYHGEYAANKKQGIGRQSWADGTRYEGQFFEGLKSGMGKLTWTTGSTYEGEWKSDMMCGHGKFVWPRGDLYIGNWADGKKQGKGTMIWGEGIWRGDNYTGDWNQDLQEGWGSYTWNDGRMYEGEWLGHKRHGVRGRHVWPDGSEYIGSFVDGKRQGPGEMRWGEGYSWHGVWADDEVSNCPVANSTQLWNRFFTLPKDDQRKAVIRVMQLKEQQEKKDVMVIDQQPLPSPTPMCF